MRAISEIIKPAAADFLLPLSAFPYVANQPLDRQVRAVAYFQNDWLEACLGFRMKPEMLRDTTAFLGLEGMKKEFSLRRKRRMGNPVYWLRRVGYSPADQLATIVDFQSKKTA
jgi:hypothetical protein